MLLSTPNELRFYLPTHVIESLDSLQMFIESSERNFLLEKIGSPLYNRLLEEYEGIYDKDALRQTTPGALTPWMRLILLCQCPVAFDMLYRAADVSGISVNESGLNIATADNYDGADKDSIQRYKSRLNVEAHRGIDTLLVALEEWAKEVGALAEDAKLTEEQNAKQEIITLWKQSKYFYLIDGLFINTARKFNEFIDIYENREKFIQLLPDLRYCQDITIRLELGDELTDDLLEKMRTNTANKAEARTVINLQRTLALYVEARNAMFKRKEAKDEAIFNMKLTLDYIRKNQGEFDEKAIKAAPFYEEPASVEEEPAPEEPGMIGKPADYTTPKPQVWKNNKRGNAIFVTKAIE